MSLADHSQAEPVLNIGLFWVSFGPYHQARLAAFQAYAGMHRVVGIEISSQTSTYLWTKLAPGHEPIVPLVKGVPAELVSGWRVYREITRVLVAQQIKVLFVPSYWPSSSMAAILAAKRLGVKLVMMNESHLLSGRNSQMMLSLKRKFVRQFDSALVGGKMHRSFFRQLGMSDNRVFDGYDMVDNAYFRARAKEVRNQAAHYRDQLNLPPKFVLSLGRFVRKKNLAVIVEAFALAKAHRGFVGHDLVFVGDGPERPQILATAARLGLRVVEHSKVGARSPSSASESPGIVRIYPFAQIDTTPAYYALATCFVLASRHEEWGLVVNEAMASSCPVLVSRVVGCAPDLVLAGETGYQFNPDNPEELAWRLSQVCSDASEGERLGANATRHIENWSAEKFGVNAMAAARVALRPFEPG